MSEKKQTAVEWYKKEVVELAVLLQHQKIDLYEFLREIGKLELQAKEMEKQQIRNAYCKGELDYVNKDVKTSKLYYKETYGE